MLKDNFDENNIRKIFESMRFNPIRNPDPEDMDVDTSLIENLFDDTAKMLMKMIRRRLVVDIVEHTTDLEKAFTDEELDKLIKISKAIYYMDKINDV